ncbi:hypothetical protein IRY61_05605 [Candidatus Saccharibacteria bacterium]|nr:hypothetical protein [Candidatus Saccharibacteria bacterium]
MSYDVILLAALAIPVLLFLILRVNAAMVFLSVCLGAVLVDHVAGDADLIVNSFSPTTNSLSQTTIELLLLLVPTVLTAVIMAFSVQGKARVFLNLFPAAATSMLLVLLAVPMLPRSLAFNLMTQDVWRILSNAEALVIGAGALVSLFFLWTQRRNFRAQEKHGKH